MSEKEKIRKEHTEAVGKSISEYLDRQMGNFITQTQIESLEKRIEALEQTPSQVCICNEIKEPEKPKEVKKECEQEDVRKSGTILGVLYQIHYDDVGLYEAEKQIRQLAIEKVKEVKTAGTTSWVEKKDVIQKMEEL